MPGPYKGYNEANYQNIASQFEISRNAERIASANNSMDEIRCELAKLELILQAMWKVMEEQGVEPSAINAKIDEIMENRPKNNYQKKLKPCPKCGKNVQESLKTPLVGRCLFCGEVVKFYPYLDEDGDGLPDRPAQEGAADAAAAGGGMNDGLGDIGNIGDIGGFDDFGGGSPYA